ncbi:serine hydrolase domain-containing protein [Maribacter sp. IgM3_T14_3]|uniref:serine hydrolase domain-containing protein n=1 Tax=Maribacter sp. IgM3_T14_3 TaxID=3415140 RepID=UPI003C6EA65F
MKNHYLKVIAVTFLLLTAFSCTTEVDEFGEDFDRDKMDLFFSKIEEKNLGMGNISIFKDGEEDYQTSFGFIDVENSISANSASKYRIASITKAFTATMIMQLVEEGKLTLETKLENHFPEIPNAELITIEQLMNHRSGLFNFTEGEYEPEDRIQPASRQKLLDIFIANGTNFSPNEKFEYSNTNYLLLSFIIEDIDEKTYATSFNDRIVTPLKLTNTYNGTEINATNNEAYSYQLENDDWVGLVETHYTILQGTGSVVSTAKGVNLFYNALFDGRLVSESSLDKMITMNDGYGFGLFTIPFYNKSGFGHDGRVDGYQSLGIYFPSDKVTLTYLSNGVNMIPNDIVIGALSIYSGLDYDLP